MVKQVDTTDLKSVPAKGAGSIPAADTIYPVSSAVELSAHNGSVTGSNPVPDTIYTKAFVLARLYGTSIKKAHEIGLMYR